MIVRMTTESRNRAIQRVRAAAHVRGYVTALRDVVCVLAVVYVGMLLWR